MNLTAIVADDEPLARAALVDALTQVWPELDVVAQVEDGPEAYQAIQKLRPTLAFLDIRMPGMTGLQVAQAVGQHTRVVFVTAYNDHALAAFEAGATDYVLKPVELVRLAAVARRLQERIQAPDAADVMRMLAVLEQLKPAQPAPSQPLQWIKASVGAQVRLIHVDDVHYFESDTKYTRVVTADGDALIRIPLKQLAQDLDPQRFWQVHRSSVVNLRQIASVVRQDETMEIVLKNRPERVKVSAQYQGLFKHM